MILVDTNIWIDHLREADEELQNLLIKTQVCTHTMVIQELAAGNLRNRTEFINSLTGLPTLQPISFSELLTFLEARKLYGQGLGVVDLHLLGAALATPGTMLWTHDRRLNNAALTLSISYT